MWCLCIQLNVVSVYTTQCGVCVFAMFYDVQLTVIVVIKRYLLTDTRW